jgi:hypothetical protein
MKKERRTKTKRSLHAVIGILALAFLPSLDGRPAVDLANLVIVCGRDEGARVKMAAAELRRYVYLRSGSLCKIADMEAASRDQIVLSRDGHLASEQFAIRTDPRRGHSRVTITGGGDMGVLYGAYRYIERLGVRFYLHGDVIPDERIATLPEVNEDGKPLFDVRGIQPFHDFPEGPDWWNRDDYLAYISQLAKMRMNFIGLHCYPEGGVGPEPLVWIGAKSDCDAQGRVSFSYPSSWANTAKNMWGYTPAKTSDFAGGAALLFPEDVYGNQVQTGLMPYPKTAEECNEVFNRAAVLLRRVFAQAKGLGVKTCIGTETPLTIPKAVRAHLQSQGETNEAAMTRELYEGIFTRIQRACPVDYYWLWTPEGWSWNGDKPGEFERTENDIQAALDALNSLGNPFTLATCGWVLGPQHDRATLDAFLPKDSPMSCINRQVGHDPVEPSFAKITGRPKWAIPWMENDPELTQPQPWVGRMRYDAADALRLGCTGLLGIHWRSQAMMETVSALASAAWDQSWVPSGFATDADASSLAKAGKDRAMPVADFYLDFARANFGEEAATEAGAIMARVDGVKMPVVVDWSAGPGCIQANNAPWEEVKKRFPFVDSFAKLRPQIRGAGNLARFDYRLNTYRAAESIARLGCLRGELDRAVKAMQEERDPAQKRKRAARALEIREDMARAWEKTMSYQIAKVDTPGELGTIANLEQHSRRNHHIYDAHDSEIAEALGAALPAAATPSTHFDGPPRLVVPTVRTQIEPGESLSLEVIALAAGPPHALTLRWRKLGSGRYKIIPLRHVARGVYSVALPPAKADLEYYVEAKMPEGRLLRWPATAPELNQTVIVAGISNPLPAMNP